MANLLPVNAPAPIHRSSSADRTGLRIDANCTNTHTTTLISPTTILSPSHPQTVSKTTNLEPITAPSEDDRIEEENVSSQDINSQSSDQSLLHHHHHSTNQHTNKQPTTSSNIIQQPPPPTLIPYDSNGRMSSSAFSPSSLVDDELHPYAFLPNILRNWLWSRPNKNSQQRCQAGGLGKKSKDNTPSINSANATPYQTFPTTPQLVTPTPHQHQSSILNGTNGNFSPTSPIPSPSPPTIGQTSNSCCGRPPPLRLGQRSLRQVQLGGGVSNPSSFKLEGVILFVDMSGFTPLSERLGEEGVIGVESLSVTLNDYFGPIVTLIESHGGDVIKFAGDAIMVLFTRNIFGSGEDEQIQTPNGPVPYSSPTTLNELVCQAVICADAVHNEFNEFSPTDGIVLKLHSAISAGTIYACVVGGAFDRYEFLLQGQAIFDLAPAMSVAKTGEIVLSDTAYQCAKQDIKAVRIESTSTNPVVNSTTVQSHLPTLPQPPTTSSDLSITRIKSLKRASSEMQASTLHPPKPIIQAGIGPLLLHAPSTAQAMPNLWKFEQIIHSVDHLPHHVEAAFPQPIPTQTIDPIGTDSVGGRQFGGSRSHSQRKNSSSRSPTGTPTGRNFLGSPGPSTSFIAASPNRATFKASPNNANAAASFIIPSVLARVQDGQGEYLAEFRRITTLFISLPTLPTHSLDATIHTRALNELSQIVCTVMSIVFTSHGEIRQLITDDKGTVIICVFGLISHTHNPLRGLKAAVDIFEKLRQRGHTINIGITTGNVFCGCIGTVHRCEYTFIGDKVNTSARLMVASSKSHQSVHGISGMGGGILCDDETLKTLKFRMFPTPNNNLQAPEQLAITPPLTTIPSAVHPSTDLTPTLPAYDTSLVHVQYGMCFEHRPPLTLKGKKQPFSVWSISAAVKSNNARVRTNSGRQSDSMETPNGVNETGTNGPEFESSTPGVKKKISIRRSTLLHDLHLKPLHTHINPDGHMSAGSSPTNTLVRNSLTDQLHRTQRLAIVGREYELELIKLRMVQACLVNGSECRRNKRKQMAAIKKMEAHQPQAAFKPKKLSATNELFDPDTKRARSSILSQVDSPASSTVDSPMCVAEERRNGAIFIESVAGFGKSALLAALMECSTTSNGLISPDHPFLDLRLEPLIAVADEFSQNIPYFTLRIFIRCLLGSFYRLAIRTNKQHQKEERARKRVAAYERMNKEKLDKEKLSQRMRRKSIDADGSLMSPISNNNTTNTKSVDYPSSSHVAADESPIMINETPLSDPSFDGDDMMGDGDDDVVDSSDEDVDDDSIDRINLENYSFRDVSALGLPPSLHAMQHLHLLNEIVPGLKLPYIPPSSSHSTSSAHMTNNKSSSLTDVGIKRDQVTEADEKKEVVMKGAVDTSLDDSGSISGSDSNSDSHDESDHEPDEEVEEGVLVIDESLDQSSPLTDTDQNADSTATESSASTIESSIRSTSAEATVSDSSDTDVLIDTDDTEHSSLSSDDENDIHVTQTMLRQTLRSMHPHLQPAPAINILKTSNNLTSTTTTKNVSTNNSISKPTLTALTLSDPSTPIVLSTETIHTNSNLTTLASTDSSVLTASPNNTGGVGVRPHHHHHHHRTKSTHTFHHSGGRFQLGRGGFLSRGEIEPTSFGLFIPPTTNEHNTDTSINTQTQSSPLDQSNDLFDMKDVSSTSTIQLENITSPKRKPNSSNLNTPNPTRTSSNGPNTTPQTFQSPKPTTSTNYTVPIKPPVYSAAAKNETIELMLVELVTTLLDRLHSLDLLSLLTPNPRRSNIGIFVDNVQWMDASSLTILQSIQRALSSVLFIFAGRNFSRNLNLTGKHDRLEFNVVPGEEANERKAKLAAMKAAAATSPHQPFTTPLPSPSMGGRMGGGGDTQSTAVVGNAFIHSSQLKGSIYIVRGEDIQREVDEKLLAKASSTQTNELSQSNSPNGTDGRQPAADGSLTTKSLSGLMVTTNLPSTSIPNKSDFRVELLFNLDYFDKIPSLRTSAANTPTNKEFSFISDPTNSTTSSAIHTHTLHQLQRAQRKSQLRSQRRTPSLVIIGMEKIEDDPTRDFENSLLLRLGGLTRPSLTSLICLRYGVDTVYHEVLEFMFEKSSGSPLYVDQMFQAMMNKEMLTIRELSLMRSSIEEVDNLRELHWSDSIRAAGGLSHILSNRSLVITDSIEDLIGQRLDSLSPSQQLIMKVCAVFGTEVYPEAVLRVIFAHDIRQNDTPTHSSQISPSLTSLQHRIGSDHTQTTNLNDTPPNDQSSTIPTLHHSTSLSQLTSPHLRNTGFGSHHPRPNLVRSGTTVSLHPTNQQTAATPPHHQHHRTQGSIQLPLNVIINDSPQESPIMTHTPSPSISSLATSTSTTAASSTTSSMPSSTVVSPLSTSSVTSLTQVEIPAFIKSRVKDFDILLGRELLKWDRTESQTSSDSGSGSDKDTNETDSIELMDSSLDSVYASYLHSLQTLFPGIHRRIYTFTHVLTRDVIYSRLPFSYRAAFHRACAEWYQERFRSNLTPHLPKLSMHWLSSARCEQMNQTNKLFAYQQALHYLLLAGQNATAKYAAKEALEYFTQARNILPQVYPDIVSTTTPSQVMIPLARKWKEVEILDYLLPCYTLVHSVPASLNEFQYMLHLVEELHGLPNKEIYENRRQLKYQQRLQLNQPTKQDNNSQENGVVNMDGFDSSVDEDESDEPTENNSSGSASPSHSSSISSLRIVQPDEIQSLLFIALLGVTNALSNGPASYGKVSNVASKVERLMIIAKKLDNPVFIIDSLLLSVLSFTFSGNYIRSTLAGFELIQLLDQAFARERAKARKEQKSLKEAAHQAWLAQHPQVTTQQLPPPSRSTSWNLDLERSTSATTVDVATAATVVSTTGASITTNHDAVSIPSPDSLKRQISLASSQAQMRLEEKFTLRPTRIMTQLPSTTQTATAMNMTEIGTPKTPNTGTYGATQSSQPSTPSTNLSGTTLKSHTPQLRSRIISNLSQQQSQATLAMRPRSVYSPAMGGRTFTAWSLIQLGYIRLGLDLLAQLHIISQRLPGSHAGLQAAGSRRLILGFLQDPHMTIPDAQQHLQAAKAIGHQFGVFTWELTVNLLRCRDGNQKLRRELMEDTWKKIDDGRRISTMFSWLVCSIFSYASNRASYALGLRYTARWWSHSFQGREETNTLAACLRYRASMWRQVWRERHTAFKGQLSYHQHRCTGHEEVQGKIPIIAQELFTNDLPMDASNQPVVLSTNPTDLPCSILLTHMFSCFYRALVIARFQSARFIELRTILTLLDCLDEIEHGICVELKGDEQDQTDHWIPNLTERAACPCGQRFIQLTLLFKRAIKQQLKMSQRHSHPTSTTTHPSSDHQPTTPIEVDLIEFDDEHEPNYEFSGVELHPSGGSLHQQLRLDEYPLYQLLRHCGPFLAAAQPQLYQTVIQHPFLSFLINLRSRAYVTTRSLYHHVVRPTQFNQTLEELNQLDQEKRTAKEEWKKTHRQQPPPTNDQTTTSTTTTTNHPTQTTAATLSRLARSNSNSSSSVLPVLPPALLPVPRLTGNDRLLQFEIIEVAVMRMEDGRRRTQWENKQRHQHLHQPSLTTTSSTQPTGLVGKIRRYEPPYTRHLRKYFA